MIGNHLVSANVFAGVCLIVMGLIALGISHDIKTTGSRGKALVLETFGWILVVVPVLKLFYAFLLG
jgi:uncharacterized membrane protein YadS